MPFIQIDVMSLRVRRVGCAFRRGVVAVPATCLLLGLSLFTLPAAPARAADWLGGYSLRGSLSGSPARWSGDYFGVDAGYSSLYADFGDAVSSLSGYGLNLASQSTRLTTYGGFIGYNSLWEGPLVLGLEAGYHRPTSDLTVSRSDESASGGTTYDATIAVTLTDYGTLRGRVGYPIGRFLPYADVGIALGRFNYSLRASSTKSGTTSVFQDEGNTDAWRVGAVAGLGLDVAVMRNVFLRAEYEYVAFQNVGEIRTQLNTMRAGLGVQF